MCGLSSPSSIDVGCRRVYSPINNRTPIDYSPRCLAPVGNTKWNQVAIHLNRSTEWKASASLFASLPFKNLLKAISSLPLAILVLSEWLMRPFSASASIWINWLRAFRLSLRSLQSQILSNLTLSLWREDFILTTSTKQRLQNLAHGSLLNSFYFAIIHWHSSTLAYIPLYSAQ